MLFRGIGRTFSTENDQQYETIGAFWDELAAKYGRENLQGLGYGWKERIMAEDMNGYRTCAVAERK